MADILLVGSIYRVLSTAARTTVLFVPDIQGSAYTPRSFSNMVARSSVELVVYYSNKTIIIDI